MYIYIYMLCIYVMYTRIYVVYTMPWPTLQIWQSQDADPLRQVISLDSPGQQMQAVWDGLGWWSESHHFSLRELREQQFQTDFPTNLPSEL